MLTSYCSLQQTPAHFPDYRGVTVDRHARCRWGAKKVSLMAQWQQYAPFVAVGGVLIVVLALKFYF
jgi:hypothetical protein